MRPFGVGASRPRVIGAVVVSLIVVSAPVCAGERAAQASNVLISPGQRILVAGFVTETDGSVDVNGETVRLLRSELRREGALGVLQGDPLTLSDEDVFRDAEYWRLVGEEYGHPLIVTGFVRLRRAPPAVSQRGGRAAVYETRPGFFLESELLLIDGTTGRVLTSKRLPRQVRYESVGRESVSWMFLAMLDRMLPDLLHAALTPPSRYAPSSRFDPED